jgi:hypothetical protein
MVKYLAPESGHEKSENFWHLLQAATHSDFVCKTHFLLPTQKCVYRGRYSAVAGSTFQVK